MKEKKKLMILGGGTLQIPLVKKCKEIKDVDVYVIVTDRNVDAPAFEYADEYCIVDATDKTGILKLAKEKKIDGILTTGEVGLFSVAYVCEQLGIPGPSDMSAKVSNNKYFMRDTMNKAGMKVPQYYCIHSLEELEEIRFSLSFPLVVKPVDVSASIGVEFVESYEAVWDSCGRAIKLSKQNEVILEEYLVGKEYSVEVLSQNGVHNVVAVTQKMLTDLPYFVESGHIIPANIDDNTYNEIKEYVKHFLTVCGIDNSASHTEIRMTKGGPMVIETGARIGGDQITADLVPLATGVSMHENIARIALGIDLNIDKRVNRYAGIRFIMNEQYTELVDRIKTLRKREDLVRVEINDINFSELKCGRITNSTERHGYYIAVADSRKGLYDLLNF